ncbi:Hypothetical Protein FCC1311_058232 [Hondaea fermentalgiana]|uniref:Uncharacterized protein n=1 Tax=Hondaea fermentalgiana TaxID=2315210 RepID=A0A2R5GF91_9STRA|nr:Hypothetical Protein FCC1311_058232 [Hondaea fermentalgiana]|eukprot:GBG29602.1 Hypothetical Protein FCC1311_058232 [Hondaea fermentalgiana]
MSASAGRRAREKQEKEIEEKEEAGMGEDDGELLDEELTRGASADEDEEVADDGDDEDEDGDDDDDDDEEEGDDDDDDDDDEDDDDDDDEEDEDENPSDLESYEEEDADDDDDDDDSGSSSESDGDADDLEGSDLDEDLLAARERILAEKEKAKIQRRAAKRKAKRARQAKLRRLKKLREDMKNLPDEDDLGDDEIGAAGAGARKMPRNPAANALASTSRKRVRAAPSSATMNAVQRSLRPSKKKKRAAKAALQRGTGDDTNDVAARSSGTGQAQLIVPKSGWKAISPLVEDFVESTLRGVCPVLLSMPRVENMDTKSKERLLRYLNECCNRIMDEVPQLTVPPTIAVGANDFPDLSRRIQVLKQENEKKDSQIEAVQDQLDEYTQEVSALSKEYRRICHRLEQLPDVPSRDAAMPGYLEPFRRHREDAAIPSSTRSKAASQSSPGRAKAKGVWANTFQTIVGL